MRASIWLIGSLLVLGSCSGSVWSTEVELRDPGRARLVEKHRVYVASITCGFRACPEPEVFARIVAEEIKASGWSLASASDPVAPDVMGLRLDISTEYRRREAGGYSDPKTGKRVIWDGQGNRHVVRGRSRGSRSIGFLFVIEDPMVAQGADERLLLRVHIQWSGSTTTASEQTLREAVRRALAYIPAPR